MSLMHFDWAAHQAEMRPNKIAIKDYTLKEEISYLELNSRASKIANYLEGRNIKAGDRVALLAKNHSIFFELQFACAKVGVILVPLNWRLTAPELSYILGDCNPELLFFDCSFGTIIKEILVALPSLRVMEFDPFKRNDELAFALKSESPEFSAVDMNLDDLIMIMYTSGTTGHPKGAKINHKMHLFNTINLSGLGGITSKTIQLVVLPLFHTGGLNCYANPVLHQGGQLVIMREFDPTGALEAIDDPNLSITHLFAVPAPLQFMMQDPKFDKINFNRLENVGVGGAPCAEIIIKKWQEKGIDVIQGWGMTETSPAGIFLAAEDSARKIGSAGKPVLHTSVKIIDKESNLVKANEVGELLIKGPNITPGYWKNDKATRESFVDGWLKTGDLAKSDNEGFIYIVDREKDMYISGGENVYPAEVENVLYQLEEIAELAVIGVPDKRWGETGKLFVVLKKNKSLKKEQIIEHCIKNLAKFKVPTEIEFIDILPRNATGKVLKRNLKDMKADN